MASERFQRRIDRILDQIEDAADRRDWASVRQGALDLFVFDPENEDAKIFLAVAQRALDAEICIDERHRRQASRPSTRFLRCDLVSVRP